MMTGKIHIRLAVLAALAALAAVLVPAGLAVGSHEGDPVTSGAESIVYLTFDQGANDEVTWDDSTQKITTKNNDCLAVSFDDPDGADLLNVTPHGGDLGEVKDGLGVRSPGDGSGEPCGRVEADDDEAISVSLGSDLSDYLMTAVDVDLELKFEADVKVEYFHDGATDPVATDMFDPNDDADDGPDSKDGDNFRYFHRPTKTVEGETVPIYFDEVKFTPTSGAISLEGGADGTTHDDSDIENGDTLDYTRTSSQFEVIKTFDGELTCGQDVTISKTGIDVSGVVTLHSLTSNPEDSEPAWDTDCGVKLYNDDVTNTSLFFEPELENTSARYTLVYTAIDQKVTTDSNGQITSLEMTYDPTPPFELNDSVPLQACQGQPVLKDDDSTSANEYVEFWEKSDVGLLPEGEFACFYSATVTTTGKDTGDEVWGIYFEDDPGWFS